MASGKGSSWSVQPGIHVYSEDYDVVCIGNVTTHPDYRGRGLAKKVLAGLIRRLQKKVSHIYPECKGR